MDHCQQESATVPISTQHVNDAASNFYVLNGDPVTDGRSAENTSFFEEDFSVRTSAVAQPERQVELNASTTELSAICYIDEVQDEIIFLLISFLGPPASSFHTIGSLSRRLRAAVTNERLWEEFFRQRFKDKINSPSTWRYSTAEAPPVRPALPLWFSLSRTIHSQTIASSSCSPSPASCLFSCISSPETAEVTTVPPCPVARPVSMGLGDSALLLSAPSLSSFRVDMVAASLRYSKRDPAPPDVSDLRVSSVTCKSTEAASTSSSIENSPSLPLFVFGGFRQLKLPPEPSTHAEATLSRRSSSDWVLDDALQCIGIPSGGKCWRGKYLLKHSLERKFAKAQFDLRRTWYVDSPTLRPRVPDGECDATDDTRSQSSRSSDMIFALDGSQPSSDGGNSSQESEDETSASMLTSCASGRRHRCHPIHLCHYRHQHPGRPNNSETLTVRPVRNTLNPPNSGLSSVASFGGAPPVCVLSLRFFGDGAGLVFAARAGGIGALCPDRGCHLRTFSLPRRRRVGGAEAGGRVRRDETRAFAGSHQAMTREVFRWETNGFPWQTGGQNEHACQTLGARIVSDSSEESEQDSEYEAPDDAGSRLQRRGSENVGELNLCETGRFEHPTFALCVAHTIDDALGQCGDAQNLDSHSLARTRLTESANFERQRPLVIGGYSDGKIGVWDYCHPDRVLEHLEVTAQRHRGLSAVKNVCAIAGGLAGRGGCDIFAGTEDGGVTLLNANRADIGIVQRLRGHTAAIQSIACERESGLVFTASRDRMVHIFDIRAGEQPVASCGRHHDWAMCVHVPDGLGTRTFETADRAVHTWDLRRLLGDFQQSGADRSKTAKALAERHRHKQLISGMRLDAFRLVSCSLDGCVLLSSLENRELSAEAANFTQQHTDFSVLRQGGETQWMMGVDFAETKMATSTVDGAVQVYHLLHLRRLPRCFLYT